jgi:hypothetical protein
VLLLCDVVRAAKELHAAGAKQERAKVQAACRQVGRPEREYVQACLDGILHLRHSLF